MADFDPHRAGGVLFPNNRKTAPNHPDFTGSLTIDAELLRKLNALAREAKPIVMDLSGWKKTAASSGASFLSLSAKEKWEGGGQQQPAQRKTERVLDDDIPF